MTRKKIIFLVACIAVFTVFLCSCSSASILQSYRYKISETSLDLKIGDGYSLGVIGANKTDTAGLNIEWTSADSKIATVDDTGFVVANAEGQTEVSAHVTTPEDAEEKIDVTYTCRVNVSVNGISLEKFGFASDEIELVKGQTYSPRITVYPGNSDNRAYTITSSDESIVKIEDDGRLTGVSEGNAVVTARTDDGNFESTASVIVSEEKNLIENVTISEESLTMAEGDTETLTVTVTPANLGLEITWSSSDTSVVSVNSRGVVTARGAGTATVTATVHDILSDRTVSCEITVSERESGVGASSINLRTDTMTLTSGDTGTYNFGATIYPSNSTDVMSWSSSDTSLVTVNASTGDFRLAGEVSERTTVTLTCRAGSVSVRATVIILPAEEEATTVTVTPNAKNAWTVGSTGVLTLSFSPSISEAEMQALTVTFEENDYFEIEPQSATSYHLTALREGSGTLRFYISSSSGDYRYTTNEFSFTIGRAPQEEGNLGISISTPNIILETGENNGSWITITRGGEPVSSDPDISFESSDVNVATVNNSGRITAHSPGTATVTVRSSDGSIDEFVTVYVYSVTAEAGVSGTVTVTVSGAEISSVLTTATASDGSGVKVERESTTSSSVTERITKTDSSVTGAVTVHVQMSITLNIGGVSTTETRNLTITII